MWLLNWLPDSVIHLMVIAGVLGIIASWFFGFMPFISQYKLPIQIISIIVLVLGIWTEGANSNNNTWLLKVKEMEAKIAKA
jgi:membrane-bound ClpP family serine protease